MSITPDIVKNAAQLARIKLGTEEEQKLSKELDNVLDYINLLNEVDTTGVEPLYQVTGAVNNFRADTEREKTLDNPNLVSQAPDSEDNFVKVRPILKK